MCASSHSASIGGRPVCSDTASWRRKTTSGIRTSLRGRHGTSDLGRPGRRGARLAFFAALFAGFFAEGVAVVFRREAAGFTLVAAGLVVRAAGSATTGLDVS